MLSTIVLCSLSSSSLSLFSGWKNGIKIDYLNNTFQIFVISSLKVL